MTDRVGFIGLGIMGRPMAGHLLEAGFDLTVHSRSPGPVDELVALGAARASNPAEVATRSDVIVTMLPDTPNVESVLFGEQGVAAVAAPGSLVADMSSIDPIATRRFAADLRVRGVAMLDAPVSGGQKGAIEATLSIMVGGADADLERARSLFEAMGTTVVHVGGAGAGQVTKACNQLVVASAIQAVAEALILAERAGVDPAKVRQALLGGFAASRVLDLHGQRMLDGAFEPGARVRMHDKDARIVQAVASAVGSPTPGFEVAAGSLARLLEEGLGDLDHSAIFLLLQELAGPTAGEDAAP